MPFTGPNDSKLPSNVEGLSIDLRRQWVGAWNGRFEECQSDGGSADECESSAFAVANGAIKENNDMTTDTGKTEEGKKLYNVDPFDLMNAQVGQKEAEYSASGGLQGKPCVECRFFVGPSNCLIVEAWPLPINSVGTSNRFEAVPSPEEEDMEPIPVVIMEGESEQSPPPTPDPDTGTPTPDPVIDLILRIPERLKDKIVAAAKNVGIVKADPEADEDYGFKFYTDADGSMRWFMWASNKYRDKDNPPELFEEKAHTEFVSYLDDGGAYPEAWLWHTPGSRWGKADWVDYADGFLMYSGTVDPGMEDVAQSLASTKGLGVSHGYRYRFSDPDSGIIGWYRDYEVSALPMEKAANAWTGIDIIIQEASKMGFTDTKRTFLVEKLGEDKVKSLETNTAGMKEALEALGVDWKDVPDADVVVDDKPTNPTPGAIDYDLIGAKAAVAIEASEGFKALTTGMSSLDERLKAVEALQEGMKQTDDEKIKSHFMPRTAVVNGHRPSADDENVLDGDDGKKAVEKRSPISPAFAQSFYGGDVEGDREP